MLTTENDLLPTYMPLKYQMDEAMEVGSFGMILYSRGHLLLLGQSSESIRDLKIDIFLTNFGLKGILTSV